MMIIIDTDEWLPMLRHKIHIAEMKRLSGENAYIQLGYKNAIMEVNKMIMEEIKKETGEQ